jgi:hypothetical protein
MIGEPLGEVLGQINPCSSSCCNGFFISSAPIIDYLYNLIFGNGDSGNNHALCSTSLLGGIPLCSWNTPLYVYNNSSNYCFCFLVHPFRDAFNFIDSSPDRFSCKRRKTQFLLELINFLAWLKLTSEIFDLPLCALMMKDFPSLIKRYWFTHLMKLASLIYM